MRRRYSMDKARDLLEDAYEEGFAEGYARAVDDLKAEGQCNDHQVHEEHTWGEPLAWCPGVEVRF